MSGNGIANLAVPIEKMAQRSGLRTEILQGIREIADRCGIQQLVLFGSRARGTNRKYSDIDLACRGGNVTLFMLDVDEETATALKFDVVNLDEPLSPEFRAEIEKEGVLFFEKVP